MQIQTLDLPRAEAIRAALAPFLVHNIPINEGQPDEEPGYIELQRCYHDESPHALCVTLFRWDGVNGVTIPDR